MAFLDLKPKPIMVMIMASHIRSIQGKGGKGSGLQQSSFGS